LAQFSTPRGTQDILPEDWAYFDFVQRQAVETAVLFGYRRIETPNFAEVSLFSRTTGQGTDIVDKEMYVFRDRDGVEMSLRPEGTAPIMRAYLQHGMSRLPQPVKLFYIERNYRYDRPQRGRYREHRQFGCEAIGLEDPYVDVEMISLLVMFYARIGLRDLSLHINSIGDASCRPAYVQDLVRYLQQHIDELAPPDRERVERNPLRVLDSKETSSQPVIEGAPRLLDYLCSECREHWDRVRHGLEILGIPYEIDPRLVRGLDYYTRTVFEFLPATTGRQAVVGGGGRYDALSDALGAPHIPGIGFGTGLERLVLTMKDMDVHVPARPGPDVFVAHAGKETSDAALLLAHRLRAAGISADMGFGNRSLKAQMRQANTVEARFAAILGEDELRDERVHLRHLDTGEQETLSLEQAAEALQARQEPA
jgi:histidyl-tRNA synthetase